MSTKAIKTHRHVFPFLQDSLTEEVGKSNPLLVLVMASLERNTCSFRVGGVDWYLPSSPKLTGWSSYFVGTCR